MVCYFSYGRWDNMIVLPLASEKGIITFEVQFRDADKRAEILQADKIQLPASDISIGRVHLGQVSQLDLYKNRPEELTKLIRKNAAYDQRVKVIYLTTANYENTEFYDVYKLPLPPEKPNFLVDFLYGFLLNDLRLRVPDKEKGKELSFAKMGMPAVVNEEIVNDIAKLKEESVSKQDFLYRLKENGYEEQLEVIDFLNTLSFSPVDNGFFSNQLMQSLREGLQAIHDTRRLKSMQKFENLASNNSDYYMNLNTMNHIFYEKPLWFEEQKIYQKRTDHK